MKSIKFKLIIITTAMILAVVLAVSIPILSRQVADLEEDILESSEDTLASVNAEVDKFFQIANILLYSIDSYVQTDNLNFEDLKTYLANLAKSSQADVDLLYYTSEIPYTQGGLCAFSIDWTPPNDFDQTTRIWFKEAKAANKMIVTQPYVDTVSGGLVVTVSAPVYKNGSFALPLL